MSDRVVFTLAFIVLVIWLLFAAPSYAVTPAEDQYGNPMRENRTVSHGATDSTLPLTGGEFIYLFGGVGLLIGAGFALKKAGDFENS